METLTVEYVVEGLLLFGLTSVGIAGNVWAIWYFSNKNFHTFYR